MIKKNFELKIIDDGIFRMVIDGIEIPIDMGILNILEIFDKIVDNTKDSIIWTIHGFRDYKEWRSTLG